MRKNKEKFSNWPNFLHVRLTILQSCDRVYQTYDWLSDAKFLEDLEF